MRRRSSIRFGVALLMAGMAWAVPASTVPAQSGWRETLRTYLIFDETNADFRKTFAGFSPEMARLGEAFARTAYAKNPELGRKNFRRLVLKLKLTHPDEDRRVAFFVPNKTPWTGYAGPVDEADGLAHFLVNTGTLPMSIFSHPIVSVIRKHGIDRDRVKPAAQCAARVLRAEGVDLAVIESDEKARTALVAKIRKAFDAENPKTTMNDEEAACLAECLPFMA